MMELSLEVPDDIVLNTYRKQKADTLCPPSVSCQLPEDNDIIDSSKLCFKDDENWLCECSSSSPTDLHYWLYLPSEEALPRESKLKNIDTRTFTRPKKRFTRPSIEKYNEELYGSDLKELTDSGIQLNGCSQDETPTKPLHFDLGQASTSVYFENILANAPMLDSFQNMSPPSLVNSMCSSTFANLMENSFIKNDPVLREIRDTDFTGSILQQETEPMFQSITESCSSLNSDIPENFLKKVSFVEKDLAEAEDEDTIVLNSTFAKEDLRDQTVTVNDVDSEDSLEEAKPTNNETYNTYQSVPRSTNRLSSPVLNHTFQRRKITKPSPVKRDLNSTITLDSAKNTSHDEKTFENIKRLLEKRGSPSLDLNRLSYLADKNEQMNTTFINESPKRNSFGSTDSGENLDFMSLSSGSSKSSKLRSTDGLNKIVDVQIMSTPKAMSTRTLWQNHEISPIRDRNSDPELSSNEPPNAIRKQRSVGHLAQKLPNPKSVNTLTKNPIRASQPNLNETRSLQKPTNLKSMGHALKGSYTSLKPTNPNLPVAPLPLDTTVTMKNPTVVQVSPVPREVPKSQDAQFAKPQPPRSGLPRPVTGIPRPVSRIPAPKSLRPFSKSAGYQGRN
ncbi:uncharacterized protein LOC664340 [Tribolium castaneum]|uniref:Uncharacterized protein n=1 Tax=Tribolium castaneum TaxID=7070 RepID=D2A3I5_TRICA|nr:PREDICTED: uncharacterized protein LOC664340 [Tribolium castaneum]EFA01903.1 hypothetical protein TcasGA2_TC007513 [Tribolium castaneum]|eukprot:XP_975442.1 PREDICTED: uncharacterized protein LOC664340 [Tribolium castaneum]